MKKKNLLIAGIILVMILIIIGIIYVSYGFVISDIINDDSKGKYFIVENLKNSTIFIIL